MEVAAYNAVKGAKCQRTCLDGGLIQACPASLSAPAPGPGSSLASSEHHGFMLPNGSLATAYDMGALPRGGLSSALQTGAPPRHVPEHGSEVDLQHPQVLAGVHLALSLHCVLGLFALPTALFTCISMPWLLTTSQSRIRGG